MKTRAAKQPAFAVVRSSLLVEVGISAARRATLGEVLSANYKRPAPRRETWSFSLLCRRVDEDCAIEGLHVDMGASTYTFPALGNGALFISDVLAPGLSEGAPRATVRRSRPTSCRQPEHRSHSDKERSGRQLCQIHNCGQQL